MGRKYDIPKASVADIKNNTDIVKPKVPHSKDNVVFSFETLEWNEYFNLDGTCNNWPFELLNMLKSVSCIQKTELITGKYSTYRVHRHTNVKPPCPFPQNVDINQCYQIRISKTKGGIHGIFYENVFYVIWLDPLHNMYPDKEHGGLRRVKAPSTCCKDRDDEIARLIDEKKQIQKECKEWEEIANTCEHELAEYKETH